VARIVVARVVGHEARARELRVVPLEVAHVRVEPRAGLEERERIGLHDEETQLGRCVDHSGALVVAAGLHVRHLMEPHEVALGREAVGRGGSERLRAQRRSERKEQGEREEQGRETGTQEINSGPRGDGRATRFCVQL
jgi:hypothetical protein